MEKLDALYAKGYTTHSFFKQIANPRSGSYDLVYILTDGSNLIFAYGSYDGREDYTFIHTITEPTKICNVAQ